MTERPTAAIGKFPYAHPTVEDMSTVSALRTIGEHDAAAQFHGAAIRLAIEAVRPARSALTRQAIPNHSALPPSAQSEAVASIKPGATATISGGALWV